jgi:hypothetical protein
VTLLALAATVPTNALESACNQAEIKEVLDVREIDELLERRRSHPGTSRLRAVLEVDGLGLDRTKSHLERRFRRLAREARLPAPTVNDSIAIPGEEMEFDFVWHRERLVVELDGVGDPSKPQGVPRRPQARSAAAPPRLGDIAIHGS